MVILVVDDNETNSQVYERVLSRLRGGRCVCMNKPDEALAWSVNNAASLVVLDYSMPDMDGLAFVKAFRGIPGRSDVPVIMLTAMNSGRVRDEAHSAGVNVFFTKPINPERFLNEATRLLQERG